MTTVQIVYWTIGVITAFIWLFTLKEITLASIIAGIPFASLAWPVLALFMIINFSERVVIWRKK